MLLTTPEEDDNRSKAMKWWRSLSYNEQDAIVNKHGEYVKLLHKYNNLSSFKIAEIMEKEGK